MEVTRISNHATSKFRVSTVYFIFLSEFVNACLPGPVPLSGKAGITDLPGGECGPAEHPGRRRRVPAALGAGRQC